MQLFVLSIAFFYVPEISSQCTPPSVDIPDAENPVDGDPANANCVTLTYDPAVLGCATGISIDVEHSYQGDLSLFINSCGNTLNVLQRPGAVMNCAPGAPFGDAGDIGNGPGNPVTIVFEDGGADPETGIAQMGGNYGVTADDFMLIFDVMLV
ncbi:hypothetical protein N9B82_06175 [Saprospiraceae bacterium]|nr:hypothetical protein [Saprospiraceae bacterium]